MVLRLYSQLTSSKIKAINKAQNFILLSRLFSLASSILLSKGPNELPGHYGVLLRCCCVAGFASVMGLGYGEGVVCGVRLPTVFAFGGDVCGGGLAVVLCDEAERFGVDAEALGAGDVSVFSRDVVQAGLRQAGHDCYRPHDVWRLVAGDEEEVDVFWHFVLQFLFGWFWGSGCSRNKWR